MPSALKKVLTHNIKIKGKLVVCGPNWRMGPVPIVALCVSAGFFWLLGAAFASLPASLSWSLCGGADQGQALR